MMKKRCQKPTCRKRRYLDCRSSGWWMGDFNNAKRHRRLLIFTLRLVVNVNIIVFYLIYWILWNLVATSTVVFKVIDCARTVNCL